MWRQMSHILAPLAFLAGNSAKMFIWTKEHKDSFQEAKRMIACKTMLAYLNFNKEFIIHTDASDMQLVGVIAQKGRPLAFYTCKPNDAQIWYSTREQELLSAVETLKTFQNILMGQRIIIYTDHKNLL